METKRAFVAILLSLAVLMGYQYFFMVPPPSPPQQESPEGPVSQPAQPGFQAGEQARPPVAAVPPQVAQPVRQGRDIPVETSLYSAVITETGGGVKSFKLKKYYEKLEPESGLKELITTKSGWELPLYFSWGTQPRGIGVPVYTADREMIHTQQAITSPGSPGTGSDILTMTSQLPTGVTVSRTMVFHDQDYLIEMTVDVHNTSRFPLQGSPFLSLTSKPFSPDSESRLLFSGAAVMLNDKLQEIKAGDLEKGEKILQGTVNWAAYEGTYFMTGILPQEKDQSSVRLSVSENDKFSTVVTGNTAVIPPDTHKQYHYTIYFGPKELSCLKQAGAGLERIVNFGWFDLIAKPVHFLLNLFYRYIHNYGLAIILVTVLIKAIFYPIAQKGMKSMKNMQKVQPKIAQIREKHKDDKERMNQELLKLYQTYKVNPVGGCLPMLLQIPVFFALYKVLLQTIELRHAPFMLWINDLSAPERLSLGFELPYLGGLPLLTLLMGGSMFLQQKMTPTGADPAQAKMMLIFMPVLFVAISLNFPSGLVLYWFVNNLLSMAQQYNINRQTS